MRIKAENLQAFIVQKISAIRAACEELREAGIIAELPEKVDFTVEVIHAQQALNVVTTTSGTTSKTATGTKPEIVETNLRTGGGQITNENGRESGYDTTHRESEDRTNASSQASEYTRTTEAHGTTETQTVDLTDTADEDVTNDQRGEQHSQQGGATTTTTEKSYA